MADVTPFCGLFPPFLDHRDVFGDLYVIIVPKVCDTIAKSQKKIVKLCTRTMSFSVIPGLLYGSQLVLVYKCHFRGKLCLE